MAVGAALSGGCAYGVRGGPEAQAYSGGPVVRFADRNGTQRALFALGIEATRGAAFASPMPGAEQASAIAGVSITVGAMRIGHIHL